jgi:hypothetical protein
MYVQVLLAIVKYAAAANLLAMLTTFFANIEPLLKAWPLSIADQRRLFLLVADVLGKVRTALITTYLRLVQYSVAGMSCMHAVRDIMSACSNSN